MIKYWFTLELQLLIDPTNVHSVNNIGIVFMPIPASIVKTIEGIDIEQTSLFINTGNNWFFSKVSASMPNSKIYPIIFVWIFYFYNLIMYQPVFKNQNSESLNCVLFHNSSNFCSSHVGSLLISSFFCVKLWLIRFNISILAKKKFFSQIIKINSINLTFQLLNYLPGVTDIIKGVIVTSKWRQVSSGVEPLTFIVTGRSIYSTKQLLTRS